jgi:hypothetical protein
MSPFKRSPTERELSSFASRSTDGESTRRFTSVAIVGVDVAVAGRTAAIELENLLARARGGVWRKRTEVGVVENEPTATPTPTFHVYASAWLESKIAGVLGDRPIDTNTQNDSR